MAGCHTLGEMGNYSEYGVPLQAKAHAVHCTLELCYTERSLHFVTLVEILHQLQINF